MNTTWECCALTDCPWCSRDDLPCHHCDGTGRWAPMQPVKVDEGAVRWQRIADTCRMCTGTGKEHGYIPVSL
ncbi:hypothetical protein GCM10022402_05590 [Salinactinospora qingdaonensis]|uniref:Uncharacterized protein n=1 Tax=Salinactinospora qingdaonensis TaxID=702744 RepID=A0ABP7EYE9_9ACTN